MTPTFRSCSSRSLPKLAVFLLLLVLLAGCAPGKSREDAPLRIGVALYTMDDTFISTISQHIEHMALETEQEEHIKINLSILDGRSNQTAQLEQIDRLLNRGCDLLCVNIVDRTAAAVIIDKAHDAQVPVVFFNRQPVSEDIQRWEQVYYLGASAQESGMLQGKIVLDAWCTKRDTVDKNGDGVLQYVMLEGEPGHQDALLRSEYATKPLIDAEVPVERLAADTANWNRGQAAAKAAGWIDEFGSAIEVVFSNNDDMALGCIDAFREAGVSDLPLIVGVDATRPALEAVRKGTLAGTVLNDAEGMARTMLDMALAIYRDEPLDQAVKLTDGHYIWLPYRQITYDDLPGPKS